MGLAVRALTDDEHGHVSHSGRAENKPDEHDHSHSDFPFHSFAPFLGVKNEKPLTFMPWRPPVSWISSS
jgi:hypothetical protein